MRFRLFAALLAVATTLQVSGAVVETLLVPADPVIAGTEVEINWVVLNSGTLPVPITAPDSVDALLLGEHASWPVKLTVRAANSNSVEPGAFLYRTYALTVPAVANGRMVLEVSRDAVLRAAFVVRAPSPTSVEDRPADSSPLASPLGSATEEPAITQFQRTFTDRFSAHQPVYFVMGTDRPAAKFQFSFKYRLLGDKHSSETKFPALNALYFGYTQRSLWDITGDSSPFYDTSYMPEMMFESLAPRKEGAFLQWLGFQAAVMHESNGRGDLDSQSMDVVYFRPMLALGHAGDWTLVFAPKIMTDIDNIQTNKELRRYRGFGEYTVILTKNENLSVAVTGRFGSNWKKGSVQVDVNYPFRIKFGDFATFFLIQYFDGYGESLAHFNEKSHRIRAGLGLVR